MHDRARRPLLHRLEWPTLALATVIYGAFLALTWYADALPWWLLLALGGYVVAWQGSLQHEAVHGHPTPWRGVNYILAAPSLTLWLPYGLYRELHLRHHADERLTDPLADPESYYVTPQAWARMGRLRRGLLCLHNTALGRVLLGPPLAVWQLWSGEARRLAGGDRRHAGHWLLHLPATAAVLAWVVGVCGVSILDYLLLFVYPGTALTLLRSFLEHRAVEDAGERTAVVEAGPLMSLLYLNNNLHVAHHAEPGVPWYRLPRRYRERRAEFLARNGGYLYRGGYLEILARYLLWPKEPPVHPLAGPRLAPAAEAPAPAQQAGEYAR